MKKIIKKVFGDPQVKKVKKLEKRVQLINDFASKKNIGKLSVPEISKRAAEIRKKIQDDKLSLDSALNEVFALTREASDKILGLRHFDVQLIGGIVLHEGNISEMRTGEGKTLVATLPVSLNAMTGRGVHVVTVNDYLAQRDAGWMAPVYHALGLSLGVIISEGVSFVYDPEFNNEEHDDERLRHLRPSTRKESYNCDITYGTNNEFGFDYLRDNMVSSEEELRQRKLYFAIVDEVDSILIDEARTPLIISAPSMDSGNQYRVFAQAVKNLTEDDYELDEKLRSVALNDQGVEKMQKMLGVENLYDPQHVQAVYHLDQALKAETLFKLDRDYVVTDGEVIIVDEFTGRLMHGRRYSEGLHQAIEAKENVEVLQESMTLATISFQNYFRLYEKLSGMTGTAETEAEEFHTIYKLDVITIPTNKPAQRIDLSDRIYKTEIGKFKSIASEVKERQNKGQPVLIGTVSVEKNEQLSRMLTKEGIKHEVLNAKNNEKEAAIVARAGQKGAVTLATNIAGRGTDIVLGEGVVELGGLHVIGTERHESRRIDNQLRGRCGRQGDPGSTQFYVSVEDDLMRIFGGDKIAFLMEKLGVDETTPIENKTITKSLLSAQKKVENRNFDSRKHVVQYDDVMNRHRKAVYSKRRSILSKEDISSVVRDLISEEISKIINSSTPQKEENNTKKRVSKDDKQAAARQRLIDEIAALIPLNMDDKKQLNKVYDDEILEFVSQKAEKLYKEREEQFGSEVMRQLERQVYLQILDQLWMQHLETMQHLREGINWRSVGQKDPLVEYRREGQNLFVGLMATLSNEVVRAIFHARPIKQDDLETELTKMAENATEVGADEVVEISHSEEKRRKREASVVKEKTKEKSKSTVKKKRKQQRQARKKNRK
jgi:preprotein translocase subunit SecA